MPQFKYIGYNIEKKRVKGTIEAHDKQGAFYLLKEKGFLITDIIPFKQSIWTQDIELFEPKVKRQDFVVFCRQFSTLLRASVGISESLQILIQQTSSKILKKVLQSILGEVRAGIPLSRACQDHPKVFPQIFISMVQAGEASGGLDEVLEKLADFFERENSIAEKIKSALVYPVSVAVLSILVTFFMMWKVVPQFTVTFQNMGIELPWITRLLIGISDFIMGQWYLFLLIPPLLMVSVRLYGRNKRGKRHLDLLKLRIPIFGTLLLKSAMARFSRTFCTLYNAAVPIIPTLTIVVDVVGNEAISQALDEAKENLRAGQPLSAPLRNTRLFPPMVVHMLSVGERTGSFDLVMGKVADYYEEETERIADQLKSLIEPLLLVGVSVVVGVIVLAILLPTFSLYGGMN